MDRKNVIAADFGASGGRVMLVSFDGKKLSIEELHRFSNDPVILNGTMYWDFLRLFYEVKQGLLKSKAHGRIESLGVDTWGVDFGLVDRMGNLIDNPVHYRDGRTRGMLKRSFEKIEKETFYHITGNQFMEMNTAFQLLSLSEKSDLLERADSLLLMPDLFNYFLSGVKASEYSIASTTQLMDAVKQTWSEEVVKKLLLPGRLLQNIIPGGTKLGPLQADICGELGMNPMDVIAVAGHDTQSALAAVPAKDHDFIFISCGTWSLFGTELDKPLINQSSETFNLTNEGGYGGKISFLKNIIGLWLIQESRRQWKREGQDYSFCRLEEMALKSDSFRCLIDPDSPEFTPVGDVPGRIRDYCLKTNQQVPLSQGQVVRCIDESLAFKYRAALEEIRTCTGKEYKAIHLVGGGVKSALLCQMTADACGCPVIAGPVEATVIGNAVVQLITGGFISGIMEAKQIIRDSFETVVYEPHNTELWDENYARFKKLCMSHT